MVVSICLDPESESDLFKQVYTSKKKLYGIWCVTIVCRKYKKKIDKTSTVSQEA